MDRFVRSFTAGLAVAGRPPAKRAPALQEGNPMTVQQASPAATHDTDLDALEAEAIFIMREVAAEFERPALLFSGGKDSIVLLRIAEKAFWPAKIPRSRSATA